MLVCLPEGPSLSCFLKCNMRYLMTWSGVACPTLPVNSQMKHMEKYYLDALILKVDWVTAAGQRDNYEARFENSTNVVMPLASQAYIKMEATYF